MSGGGGVWPSQPPGWRCLIPRQVGHLPSHLHLLCAQESSVVSSHCQPQSVGHCQPQSFANCSQPLTWALGPTPITIITIRRPLQAPPTGYRAIPLHPSAWLHSLLHLLYTHHPTNHHHTYEKTAPPPPPQRGIPTRLVAHHNHTRTNTSVRTWSHLCSPFGMQGT